MNAIEIKSNLKEFIAEELKSAEKYCEDKASVENIQKIAFGALAFTLGYLLPVYDEELAGWWEDEILPKFRKIRG